MCTNLIEKGIMKGSCSGSVASPCLKPETETCPTDKETTHIISLGLSNLG